MPATKRPKPLYQRGEFRLYRRADRDALEIVWYDDARKRERSRSAGTTIEGEGRIELDNLYVEKHGGVPHCRTCGQPLKQESERLTVLIANYLETFAPKHAVHPRLGHVLDYLEAKGKNEERADRIDEDWVSEFRTWSAAEPIILSGGKVRAEPRAPATTEGSLLQLAAAMRFGGVDPAFKPMKPAEVARTPMFRSSVEQIAAMFRFCLYPAGPTARTEKERDYRRRERANLLRYLRAAVVTWARPDAIMDIDTRRERRQWHSDARVLALNPAGRRQTRKRRATIVVARQFAPHLDATVGPYIPVNSVKSSWETMSAELKLPGEGEAGMKLIRRSIMTIARKRLGEEHWIQGKMFAGHVPMEISDIYALPDPANLGLALAVTEEIVDEIEALCPGAYRTFTAEGSNVVTIAGAKR
jgi:hypothetical protein